MISILIPIYNGIEFIEESVDSVLAQSYDKWELLIGVNGHAPNSEVYNIAKRYESISDKIKVFDFYNIKGKSKTLNEMIKYCNYNYVAILDVDDIWHPLKLEIQSYLFLNNYDVIGTNCLYFGDINDYVPSLPIGDISNFNFNVVNPIVNSSCIIKRELCHWDNNMEGIDDYNLWLKLRKQKKTFYNCKDVLVKHRIHKTSAFNSSTLQLNKKSELLQMYTNDKNTFSLWEH